MKTQDLHGSETCLDAPFAGESFRRINCFDATIVGKAYCPDCAGENPTIKELGWAWTAKRSTRQRRTTGIGSKEGAVVTMKIVQGQTSEIHEWIELERAYGT